jgi:2-oxoglutarate ferredoxin oxidoreductase subunit alpha
VSPLVPFGAAGTVRFTGSTHDERAFLTKDPSTVGALNRHLVAKVEEHRDEIEEATLTLDPRAATLFVAYGVTAGAMREAAARLADADRPASTLTLQSLWPVPEAALAAALEGHRRVVVAELNHGLYRREVERLAGGREVVGLTRVDGELITPRQFEETWA